MSRRPVVALALITAAAVSVVPAQAATKRPKPIKGSYTLTLLPDPTPNVTNTIGKSGCGVIPQSQNKHPFTVPAAGTLHVVLDSPNPTGNATVSTDWDLYVLDAEGAILDSSNGGTSHEETSDKLKKKQAVTFWVCNLAGEPNGTVSYTFTYA
ncbi:MAG: hypothetical protein QOG99_3253 [Frankiales bacterium]|jgi:hypothetical protein|nr:hypothetical protein [Frankiales bacterium]